MAKFYGTIQGSRGQASRLGHSHIVTKAASWDGAVNTVITERDGETWVEITTMQHHNAGSYNLIYDGPLAKLMSAPRLASKSVIASGGQA